MRMTPAKQGLSVFPGQKMVQCNVGLMNDRCLPTQPPWQLKPGKPLTTYSTPRTGQTRYKLIIPKISVPVLAQVALRAELLKK